MNVKLKFLTTLPDLARTFRFSTDTLDKSDSTDTVLGENDKRIIESNLINTENPHNQLLKTVQIQFEFNDITRALLQEVSKHQVGVCNVTKSTRYTLGKIANDESLKYLNSETIYESIVCCSKKDNVVFEKIKNIIEAYYCFPDSFHYAEDRLAWCRQRLQELANIYQLKNGWKLQNDELKKYVNENMLCSTAGVISGLALKNLLKQRLDSSAWYQFQDLAKEIFNQIPEEWKFLFKVHKYKKVDVRDNIKFLDDLILDINDILVENDIYQLNRIKEILKKDLVEKIYLN